MYLPPSDVWLLFHLISLKKIPLENFPIQSDFKKKSNTFLHVIYTLLFKRIDKKNIYPVIFLVLYIVCSQGLCKYLMLNLADTAKCFRNSINIFLEMVKKQ